MKKAVVMLLSFLIIGTCASCAKENTLFDRICTADEALKASKKDSIVVFEDLKCTSGDEIWNKFYETVSRGESASVFCAHYYTLNKDSVSKELYEVEKDLYPMLFFYTLEYDGDTFTVTVRQSTEKETEYEEQFKYLMHYTGDAPVLAKYASYDDYVLVDDPTVTREEIMAGIVSSQPGVGAKHCFVYKNTFD
ncbi:MAG: hypothetical protein J1F23_03445 [Oscillospiraceae bacterium]|nr:hypothetical protein [Oscillospiraceae bacterium]